MPLPRDDHKTHVAEVFDRTAGTYDRVGSQLFGPLGARLVELAGVSQGARVLDVATGTGAALVPAARAAGPDGYVLGIDIAPRMLAAAAAAIPQGCARVELRVMDAERLDALPGGGFHVVLCACALSFLERPSHAVEGFRRALEPGGTLAASRWSEADARWAWYGELLHEAGVEPRRLMTGSPDPAVLLAEADFEDVAAVAEPFELVFAEPDEWWRWLWAMPYRAALERLSEGALERLRADAFERLEGQRERDGSLRLRAEARYVTGRRP